MNNKYKVGRPRLANSKQKKNAIIWLASSLFLVIAIISVFLINDMGVLNLKASASNSSGLKKNGFIYYSQLHRYTRFCGRSGATIGTSGCGVTSMAMVLRNLYGDKKYTPEYTMREAYKGHFCGAGISGTYWKYFPYSAKIHNLKYYNIPKNASGVKKIKEILKNGGLVIVNVGYKSPFTHGGHYMVLYKLSKSGRVYVANPSKRPRTLDNNTYDLQKDFLNKGWTKNGWWGFELKNKTTTTKKVSAKITTPKLASSSTSARDKLEKMEDGRCPVAPTINPVLLSGSTYRTDKVEYSVNISNLTEAEQNKLYILAQPYDKSRVLTYTRLVGNKGKTEKKKEKIGVYKNAKSYPLKSILKKSGERYTKVINTDEAYHITLYSGGKKCYDNFFVKDGYNFVNNYKKYVLSKYNIVTSKGIVKGAMSNAKVKSSDSKVFKVNNKIDELSLKAAFYGAKDGSEKNKSAVIKMTNGNLSGTFKVTIPDRYLRTTYLSNPLTGGNTAIGKAKLKKASNTKDKNGNKLYGVEFVKNPKTKKALKVNDKVYAMDSGTVTTARAKQSSKDTYGYIVRIKSTVNSEENEIFIHSYAHLNKLYVKKGMRVHKGQVIGTVGKTGKKGKNLSKPTLYVTLDHINLNKKSEVLLLNNFIGRNLSYSVVNNDDKNYKAFQSYIENKDLCKYYIIGNTCN